MTTLDFAAIEQAPLAHDPYDHLIVPGAITAAAMAAINDDFPRIDTPGSHPVATLDYGPAFAAFLDTLRDKPFARTIGAKLGLTLDDKPVMITVRGRCRKTDGKIHIDSSGKLVTVLIYMNNAWEAAGGQLRLLRNSHDIDDYAVELPPAAAGELAWAPALRGRAPGDPAQLGAQQPLQVARAGAARCLVDPQETPWQGPLTWRSISRPFPTRKAASRSSRRPAIPPSRRAPAT
jgi:SM-20-related protein